MRVESSAYLIRAGWLSMLISRSLIKMLNKYGPLTLPCVVPLFTHSHCPWKLLFIIHCWRFSRKLKYQLIINPVRIKNPIRFLIGNEYSINRDRDENGLTWEMSGLRKKKSIKTAVNIHTKWSKIYMVLYERKTLYLWLLLFCFTVWWLSPWTLCLS